MCKGRPESIYFCSSEVVCVQEVFVVFHNSLGFVIPLILCIITYYMQGDTEFSVKKKRCIGRMNCIIYSHPRRAKV
jgi:hypothetical protein